MPDIRRPAVPQVASDATTVAQSYSRPNPPRPAPAADQATTPFDSLIDDGTQTPAAQPAQSPPAPSDKTAPAAQPDSAQPPVKAKDGDAAKTANTDTTAKAADIGNSASPDATATDCKLVGDGKVKADAKICETATATDDVKPAGDGKPTDGPVPAALAADPASNPIQTIMPVAAVAPAPGTTAPAAPAATQQPAPAAVQAAIVAADAPKAKALDLAARQADAGTPADDSKSSAKAAFELQGDGKPQSAAGEADKQAAAHPHDEVPVNTHHAAAETPPPIAIDAQAAAPKTTGDIVQQAALTPPSQDVAPAAANPAAPAPPAAQPAAIPLAGVAIEIAGHAMAGKNRFEIRLDPPELGRIEVRLDVDRDGQVTTRLIADRSDTLDLLRRDASGLERALQDAGLKTADNGLQFSLRDQTMGREQSNTPTPGAAQIIVHDDALPVNDATQRNYSRLAGLRGGIDIRV
jgi:flagellar hook-length control protein FliK